MKPDKEQIRIGKRLKKIRKMRYITSSNLASRVGVSPQMVSLWEKGKRDIRNKHLAKIANILDISVSDLFNKEMIVRKNITFKEGDLITPETIRKRMEEIEPDLHIFTEEDAKFEIERHFKELEEK